MTKPGLSSFKEDAEGAAKSLDVLLQVAMDNVPEGLKACTPIAVKATAGLRLLGPEKSQKILDAVRNRLETVYPFPVVEGDGVQIMDGKDEGSHIEPRTTRSMKWANISRCVCVDHHKLSARKDWNRRKHPYRGNF